MLKIRQVLALQQSLKHPGPVSRFLQGYQVLNLMEGRQSLDPILWESILEDNKVSGLLGKSSCVFWIVEELQLDPLSLVCIWPIHLFHLLYLGNKGMG
jgi:hypothetical protein